MNSHHVFSQTRVINDDEYLFLNFFKLLLSIHISHIIMSVHDNVLSRKMCHQDYSKLCTVLEPRPKGNPTAVRKYVL